MPSTNEEELGSTTYEVLVELRRCADAMEDFSDDVTHKKHAKAHRAGMDLTAMLVAWRNVKWNKKDADLSNSTEVDTFYGARLHTYVVTDEESTPVSRGRGRKRKDK